MSSYSDLATQIINKKGQGGRFSGLNQFLDVKQAYADAQRKFQFDQALQSQQNRSEAAKGIAQAGLMSGITSDPSIAMQQYNQMTGGAGNIASGTTIPSTIPNSTPIVSSSGVSNSVNNDLPPGQTQLYGFKGVEQQQKNQAVQDKLETQYTNNLNKEFQTRGNLGALKTKVNQAAQLRTLLDQGYDQATGTYDIKPAQYTDLAIGLANLISPNGVSSDSKIEGIRQKTLSGDFNAAIGYLSGMPQKATTTPNFQLLADSINREGLTAEDLLNRNMKTIVSRYPTNLNEETKKRLQGTVMGGSYSDFFKQSPAYATEGQKLVNLLKRVNVSADNSNSNDSTMPFQVGQDYNGHKILSVKKVN